MEYNCWSYYCVEGTKQRSIAQHLKDTWAGECLQQGRGAPGDVAPSGPNDGGMDAELA